MFFDIYFLHTSIKTKKYNNLITNKNLKNKPIQIINIYASWCGWSRKLLPEWRKIENYFKNNKKIVVQKYEEQLSRDLIKKFNVRGYPSIFKINSKEEITEYPDNLPRTSNEIIRWAKE